MTRLPDLDVCVRPRTPADLPELVEVLTEQQPFSRYPLRWPLPSPVDKFLVRDTEEQAWVAEQGGRPVGHVSVGRVAPDRAELFREANGATGAATEPAAVSVLFVARHALGAGIGGLLLDSAVAWVRARGRLPVLDVVPRHSRAIEVYRHRGWCEVGRIRPDWLPEDEESLILMALPPKY